jgi:type I restriction enzyme R subunit
VNRIHENKSDTFILDFINKSETIEKAFKPYYENIYLKEVTYSHKLYNLQDKIMDYYLFTVDEVEKLVEAYKRGDKQSKSHNMFNDIVNEFKKLDNKEQLKFKKDLRKYQNIYSFLSQLIPFEDVNLEKLFIFNEFLNKIWIFIKKINEN